MRDLEKSRGRKYEYLRDVLIALLVSKNDYKPGDEFNVNLLSSRLDIPWETARRNIDRLAEMNLLQRVTNNSFRLEVNEPIQVRNMVAFVMEDREYRGRLMETDFPEIAPEEYVIDGTTRVLVRILMDPGTRGTLGKEQIAELLKRKGSVSPNSLIWEGLEDRLLDALRTSGTVSEAIEKINHITESGKLATLQLPENVREPTMVVYRVSPSLIMLSLVETPFDFSHLPFKGQLEKADGKTVDYIVPGLFAFINTVVLSIDCLFYPEIAKVWKRIDSGARVSLTIPRKKKETLEDVTE